MGKRMISACDEKKLFTVKRKELEALQMPWLGGEPEMVGVCPDIFLAVLIRDLNLFQGQTGKLSFKFHQIADRDAPKKTGCHTERQLAAVYIKIVVGFRQGFVKMAADMTELAS